MTRALPPVLVTDGEQRASLALVRSLGRAGHAVYTCSPVRRSLAGASRYCWGESQVPDALDQPDEYVRAIRRLLALWQPAVLLPVSEASLLAILPERNSLGDICLPVPTADCFRRLSDKSLLMELAPSLGIAVPEQHVIPHADAWGELAHGSLRFPVVLKPARSVVQSHSRRLKLGVRHVASLPELEHERHRTKPEAYPLLLQQRIVGPGVGIFMLLWKGEVLALFAHRRLREKPPSGGVSVYRESISADPSLVERSRALLEALGWYGVAMVEYKIDAASGVPYLMEANGRFWGSLQLAIDAGVDFPRLLVEAALGQSPSPVHDYRTGVRSRWWWGDVDHLLARLRRSAEELALPPGAPSRWRTVRDVLTPWRRGDRSEILRLDDPLPFLRETVQWLTLQ